MRKTLYHEGMSIYTLVDLERIAPKRYPFLTKKQAMVIYLALNEGMANDDIAARLGCSYQDVALLIHRATKRVKAEGNRQALVQIFLLGAVHNGMREPSYTRNLDLVSA